MRYADLFVSLQSENINMNQDIHKLVELYEANRNYYLTDRYNETQVRNNTGLHFYISGTQCPSHINKTMEKECFSSKMFGKLE